MLRPTLSLSILFALAVVAQPVVCAAASVEEAPESAVSSPPMEMDDPGTPGAFGIEVNFVASWIRAGATRSAEGLFDANYGIGDRIQLKYERPYLSEGEVGLDPQRGMGPTELGVKWRFLDSHGMAAAIYPQYQYDDGFVLYDEEGNPEQTEGRSAYLPLLFSKQVGDLWTLALNLGYRRNLDHRGDDENVAIGAGRAFHKDQRLLVEVFSERDQDFNNRQTDFRVGYVLSLFPKTFEKTSFEIPAYVSLGHSLGRIEAGERSTSFTFGVSFIRKPSEHS